jgi:hypothetical protein
MFSGKYMELIRIHQEIWDILQAEWAEHMSRTGRYEIHNNFGGEITLKRQISSPRR